ncbi:uncharacterized protein LOC9654264 [Selaginella moellendorffii]|nr:uncharacterized protein LOC9654264 [Selaginella moellendorffii]|eukprot:XP_002963951.2 uncharacterized protein LOC9654264 [Selaginella moellendorffii]
MDDDSPELGLGDDEDEDEYAVVTRILDSFLHRPDDGDCAAALQREEDPVPGSAAAADGDASNQDALAIVPVSYPEEPIVENASSSLAIVQGCEENGNARFDGGPRRTFIMEMQVFVEDMKKKSRRRLKNLDQKDKLKPEEADKINRGLETITMLDMKLQELERGARHRRLGGREYESDASRKLRDERKRRRRYAKLKRSLENLDALHPEKQGHVLRNILLGPSARYFRLTPEEEAMVEELLRQQDIVDDDGDNSSVISHVSTAFDVEGQEAVRLAEIDCRLDPYKESHSYYSISPMASSSTPNSKTLMPGCPSLSPMASVSTPKSKSYFENGESRTKSEEFSVHHEALSRALEPFAGTTVVEDYLGELKERREYEEKMEEIDKKLRQLHMTEAPAGITDDQLMQLLSASKREQELYAAIQ